jgi:hypothetical protein
MVHAFNVGLPLLLMGMVRAFNVGLPLLLSALELFLHFRISCCILCTITRFIQLKVAYLMR